MAKGYTCTLDFVSKEGLTKREQIMLKDTADCVRLDKATEDGYVVITPDFYANLVVHNDNAKDDKDYRQYVIVDKSGTKYLTGSESFMSQFEDICSDMMGENGVNEEDFSVKAYRVASKNREGKYFLTCSII